MGEAFPVLFGSNVQAEPKVRPACLAPSSDALQFLPGYLIHPSSAPVYGICDFVDATGHFHLLRLFLGWVAGSLSASFQVAQHLLRTGKRSSECKRQPTRLKATRRSKDTRREFRSRDQRRWPQFTTSFHLIVHLAI